MPVTKYSTAGMSREEWEAARRGSIGGSDAAAVVGLTPYKSPYTLWAEKTGAVPEEDVSTKEAVRVGSYLEQYVAERFCEETGLRVRRENSILRNTEYPFAHANVDRLIIGERAGLECKTTSSLNMKRFSGGNYPANYYAQCMHYMMVTGFPVWYLAVLIGNSDFRIFKIERDEAEIEALINAERDFWCKLQSRTPPAIDGFPSTGETLTAIAQAHGYEEAPALLTGSEDDIQRYLALKAQHEAATEKLEEAANALKQKLCDATSGLCGSYAVSWKPYTSKRFDKARFQKDHPEIDMSQYTTETISRRFSVKEIKHE